MIHEKVKYVISFYYKSSNGNIFEELFFTSQHALGRFLYKVSEENGEFLKIIPDTIKVYYISVSKFNDGCIENIKNMYINNIGKDDV
jgi:hypothetical protein